MLSLPQQLIARLGGLRDPRVSKSSEPLLSHLVYFTATFTGLWAAYDRNYA